MNLDCSCPKAVFELVVKDFNPVWRLILETLFGLFGWATNIDPAYYFTPGIIYFVYFFFKSKRKKNLTVESSDQGEKENRKSKELKEKKENEMKESLSRIDCISYYIFLVVVFVFFSILLLFIQRYTLMELKEVYNPIRRACEHVSTEFSTRSKQDFFANMSYINRTEEEWEGLKDFKRFCFDERIIKFFISGEKCHFVLTGLSSIGKSTLLREELKDLTFVMYLNFKKQSPKEENTLNILCQAMDLICDDNTGIISVLNVLREVVGGVCPKTLIILEDLSDEDPEKATERIPESRKSLIAEVNNLHEDFGTPFVISSSDSEITRLLYSSLRLKMPHDIKPVYLQGIEFSTLNNNPHFIEIVNNLEDRNALLDYSEGNWDDIRNILSHYINGVDMKSSIEENNRFLCNEVLTKALADIQQIPKAVQLIKEYEGPFHLMEKIEFQKTIKELRFNNILGLTDGSTYALSRPSLKNAMLSKFCNQFQ